MAFYSILCADLNGNRIQKEGIYVYIQLIHFVVQQKLTRHGKATLLQQNKNKKQIPFLQNYTNNKDFLTCCCCSVTSVVSDSV